MIPRLCAHGLERIRAHLACLYEPEQIPRCMERLVSAIGRYGVGLLDSEPASAPTAADMVLITYADMLRSPDEAPLRALRHFVSRRLHGAINTVHLLPFFPWSSDDGFSVVDYRAVAPDYGTWNDIEALGKEMRLMVDLVLNHVSRKSDWFRDYTNGIAPARHYFIEVAPSTDLSAVMRPRTSPLLSAALTKTGQRHVWTTFSDDQIDLNFANPDVLFEMIDILLIYLSRGARILRLDAIAYLWKTIGTECIHLPQTHTVVKLLRAVLDMIAPETILLTETNVPHAENISYFGDGDEARMVYQFPLPPLLLHAVHRQDAAVLTRWAASLPAPPTGCAYLNFTASHDGIGVRPLQGLVPDEELRALAAGIRDRGGRVSSKRNADGSESPYELNISFLDAVSEPGGRDREGDRRRFLTTQAIMLALQGVPAVYFHSLCGTRNDIDAVQQTGIARRINRRKFEASALAAMLDDPDSEPHAVFAAYTRMLRIRAAQPAFAPAAAQRVLDVHPACFAVQRESALPAQTLFCISNLSGRPRRLQRAGELAGLASQPAWRDLLTDTVWSSTERHLALAAWQTVWLG